MRTRSRVAVVTCLLAFGGAVSAWAIGTTANSTLEASFKTGTPKAGTKAKPRANSVQVLIKGATKNGKGQPATTTRIVATLAKGWRFNSKRWPASQRCDIDAVIKEGDDSVCPQGSKVGAGKAAARGGANEGTASGPANGVTENIDVTVHVIENGNFGLLLVGKPVTIQPAMIEGKVSGRKLTVDIPTTIQAPAGVPSGIVELPINFKASTTVKRKRTSIIETTACSGRKWTFNLTLINRDGKVTDTDTRPCRK